MKKNHMVFLIILAILVINISGFFLLNQETNDMSYPSFLQAVEQKQVDKVTMKENSNFVIVQLKKEADKRYQVPNPGTEDFTEFLLINGVEISHGEDGFLNNGMKAFLLLVVIGGIMWYVRRGGRNLIQDATKNTKNEPLIRLDSVAGNVEAKAMVDDIIQFIKDPEKYSAVGARMPKGLLLYGPPGTGKTLMAKAIAGEAEVPFYAMSGSDFVQMYVGVGASRIRNLFQKAKKNKKAVIFIDEIDAIGKKRARNSSASNDERDQTLNALLTEMSGFHENSGIVIIGATNRLDTLDEALLRPGRFDRQIEIGLPDVNSRKKILLLHTKSKPLSDNVDLESLAKSTVYFSGAMLENLINESAIFAANDDQPHISKHHIEKAFYTVIAGAQKTDRSYITDLDRKVTAFHEAGHALTTKLLLPEHFISKVTIIPSVRGAGGFSLSIPKDTLFQTQSQIKANIQVLLAGRAAEEIIFGKEEVTTGAGNDIQKASAMIVDYINKFGMDDSLGMFSIDALGVNQDNLLIEKCREQMNLLYHETKNLLEQHLSLLKKITEHLIEAESLSGDDIEQICNS